MVRACGSAAYAQHRGCDKAARAVTEGCAASVHSLHHLRLKPGKRPNVAHAVPWVKIARSLALGLIALEEARHEKLASQRGEAHASGLAVAHEPFRMIRIHHFSHGFRRGWIVNDGEVVLGDPRLVH